MSSTVEPLALAVLVTGGLALLCGLRGRRVSTAPHCRRCAFNLSGAEDARTGQCPECGAELSQRRAVRAGLRRTRPVFVLAGVLFFIVGTAMIGFIGVARVAAVPAASKPAWWLLFDVHSGVAARADLAARECLTRRTAGTLTDKTLGRLIGVALARQSDPQSTWDDSAWPSLMSAAITAGLMSTDELARYRENALVGCTIEVGDGSYRLLAGTSRTPRSPRLAGEPRVVQGETIGILAWPATMTHDGEPFEPSRVPVGDGWWRTRLVVYARNSTTLHTPLVQRDLPMWTIEDLPVGEHDFEIRYRVECYHNPPDPAQHQNRLSAAVLGDPMKSTTMDTTVSVTVAELAEDAMRFVDASSDVPAPFIGPSARGRETATPWTMRPGGAEHPDWYTVYCRLERRRVPGDIAYAGFTIDLLLDGRRIPLVARPGQERPLSVVMSVGDGTADVSMWGLIGAVKRSAIWPIDEIDEIDVILTPDPDAVLVFEAAEVFWNDRVVLRNVPLDWTEVIEDANRRGIDLWDVP